LKTAGQAHLANSCDLADSLMAGNQRKLGDELALMDMLTYGSALELVLIRRLPITVHYQI
jgi:hypothetical protein